jgi:hypothetical protein
MDRDPARFSAAVDEEFQPLTHIFAIHVARRAAEPAQKPIKDDGVGFPGLWLIKTDLELAIDTSLKRSGIDVFTVKVDDGVGGKAEVDDT